MQGYPTARAGQVVGLLGGSFDPPHSAHVHITKTALRRFGLDKLWWLVSPGNPLKANGPAPLAERVQASRAVMKHPKVEVTDLEARLGTRFTAQTLAALIDRYPGVRFVWLMGADNLGQFDQWQDWQWIMETVPIGVMARPGDRISARMSKAARVYRDAKLSGRSSQVLGQGEAPRWCFINMPMSDMSSTAIRARGEW
ncbi:nicotinate-nucleotide adenylyltransferase [Cognatiyoonia sediminum]|uniref:Probable nicotinate-nucleotide adenylyltransferase n=1 Tax=Cognatiyoonia sediminum TaxID=1508389 RepID=A0A1M5NVF9_9RHOB|nr:nicotinate-nucleotide adenylyltransferase [Cognatiyoonia sediminum]SHG93521.1 nicotinate-nucleotide adenylyltransferase [Cognatiyoonia sediminum]